MSPLTFFKCLSEETRLKSMLLIAESRELCVCDLQVALDLSQPKVSRHLAELRKCGLLNDHRRGKWVFYRLNPELPHWVIEILHTTAAHHADYLKQCHERLSRSQPSRCVS